MPGSVQDTRIVFVTLDRHAAGPIARVAPGLAAEMPGLTIGVHAAAEWAADPAALEAAKADVARADILIVSVLFLD